MADVLHACRIHTVAHSEGVRAIRCSRSALCLGEVIADLKHHGIRTSLFMDFVYPDIEVAHELRADRIELYTEPYANAAGTSQAVDILTAFERAALRAQSANLGVNAGHDLKLQNLPQFLGIPGILEVSIGHALITECIELGVEQVIGRYLQIAGDSSPPLVR